MNHSFYQDLFAGDPTRVVEDPENVIWIDWGDEEDEIVEALQDHIGLDELQASIDDADNEFGYEVKITLGKNSVTVNPNGELHSLHATLNAVDELLTDYQVRFVTPTNGSDTIAVAVEKNSDWDSLYQEFGRMVNETFCPIREIPDLMNTPGNEIDEACQRFADRIG